MVELKCGLTGYFDANATLPVLPEVCSVFEEALQHYWQNPAGAYGPARRSQARLRIALQNLQDLLGLSGHDLIITSGGSEGNFSVMEWFFRRFEEKGVCLLSPWEHPSVEENARSCGGSQALHFLDALPDATCGHPDPDGLFDSFNGRPGLLSMMAASNETGVLQPWEEWAIMAGKRGWYVHVDACQIPGKVLGSPCFGDIDFITWSGHKLGAPKGVGLLAVGPRVKESFSIIKGGGQQSGHRAGTENTPLVLALEKAWSLVPSIDVDRDAAGRDQMEKQLAQEGFLFWGASGRRLSNTSCMRVPFGKSSFWIDALDRRGFQVSAGAACASESGKPSAGLARMGLGREDLDRVIRVSAPPGTHEQAWITLAEAFLEIKHETRRRPHSPGNVVDLENL